MIINKLEVAKVIWELENMITHYSANKYTSKI